MMNYRIKLTSEGRLAIRDTELEIPNYHLDEIIGLGANGIVIHATHRFLSREVAVKIWLKLRARDRRDKFRQGIMEANKASRADLIKHTRAIRVYEAGNTGGYFYAVMEYYKGLPLRKWLSQQQQKLGVRIKLAEHLSFSVYFAGRKELIHGDLHTENVLVSPRYDSLAGFERVPDFRIIDYGTSVFSSKEYSADRHWRVFEETFNELIYPFNILDFCTPSRPNPPLMGKMLRWFDCYTFTTGMIRDMVNSMEVVKVYDHDFPRAPLSESHRAMLDSLLASGKLKTDPSWLGNKDEWIDRHDRIEWSFRDLLE